MENAKFSESCINSNDHRDQMDRLWVSKTWQFKPVERLTSRMITGRSAENLVCFYLKRRGWRIRERNYASSKGEIDIIAEKWDEDLKGYPTVAFVEVKARTNGKGLAPALSVSKVKQKRMTAMQKLWIGRHAHEKAVYRFDIASLIMERRRLPKIEYYRNAFVGREEFGWSS